MIRYVIRYKLCKLLALKKSDVKQHYLLHETKKIRNRKKELKTTILGSASCVR